MFGREIRQLLIQVISSWQVIAVTVVLVVYIFLVNYVARFQQRKPSKPLRRPRLKKPEIVASHESDELGLEESDAENEKSHKK